MRMHRIYYVLWVASKQCPGGKGIGIEKEEPELLTWREFPTHTTEAEIIGYGNGILHERARWDPRLRGLIAQGKCSLEWHLHQKEAGNFELPATKQSWTKGGD